ncbi:MAG: hypothetical protein KZQ66_17150 [Candidatus Thiodiazotropha sp. (ex Lucinoma aequizonata)]|nr:hypothetical protein [Candidatus Thiodiazotropha sp. (ex Lucinoma aequizonata)]MCU7887253.1 hypothetical protein [Candidatus Thiodiazotropha sp. (ex Lucinoma aequizonata)]MCU7895035.1 hypothetical protein [Candidatus Thiodiazotropha sp. (ex Lucinoma aequizonata)]MCU7900032.1 hypothetical protein [Candidatus Thiodiazotropha sp. (ex Lucinoma aequizonata)]MCU7903501.1 hypothetical protein [Candidatus Thiodiazotropha sp. (ex Lucinoma aequizonata)]
MSKGEFSGITPKKKKVVPAGADDFASQAKVYGSKPSDKEPTKRLNVEIPETKFNALKAKTAVNGQKLREVVESWVDEYLIK